MDRREKDYESEYVFDNAVEIAEDVFEEQEALFPGITDSKIKKRVEKPISRKKDIKKLENSRLEPEIKEQIPKEELMNRSSKRDYEKEILEQEISKEEKNDYYFEKELETENIEPEEYMGKIDGEEDIEEYHVHIEEEDRTETFDNKSITTIEEPSKNKKIKMILAILSILGILFIAYIAYYFIKVDPKFVLVKSLDNWTESVDYFVKPLSNFNKISNFDVATSKGTIQLKVEAPLIELMKEDAESKEFIDMIETLNNMSFTIDNRIDINQKKNYFNLIGLLKNEELFNIIYTSHDKKQYIFLKNVFEKYIQLEEIEQIYKNEDYIEFEENMIYLIDVLKQSLNKNMKSSYLETTDEEILIDGEKVKTTKVTLVLNNENSTELENNIIKDLRNDEKTNAFLSSIYPEFSNYEVKSSKEELYYSVNVLKGTKNIVKSSIYNNEMELTYTKGENEIFEIRDHDNIIFHGILEKKENGFHITITDSNDTANRIEINGGYEDSKINYQLIVATEKLKIESSLNSVITEVTKNELYKENAEISISATYQGVKIGTMTLLIDMDTKKGAEIDEVNEFITVDELTEEDGKKLEIYIEDLLKKIVPNIEPYIEEKEKTI